jgi:GntR family transcriptional regulator of vanillate catabolism
MERTHVVVLKECLGAMEDLVSGGFPRPADFESYVEQNGRFHITLIRAADSTALSRQYARAIALPFASPGGFVTARGSGSEAMGMLAISQEHHRGVVEAIDDCDSARAEAIMREHARLSHQNLQLVLRDRTALNRVPGLALVQERPLRVLPGSEGSPPVARLDRGPAPSVRR